MTGPSLAGCRRAPDSHLVIPRKGWSGPTENKVVVGNMEPLFLVASRA